MSDGEQPPIETFARSSEFWVGHRLGALEGLARIRIGKLGKTLLVRERRETCELASASFAHGDCKLLPVVGEKKKWRTARVFFTHEQERNLRTKQLQRRCGLERGRRRQSGQSLAKGSVANLVVVLQK